MTRKRSILLPPIAPTLHGESKAVMPLTRSKENARCSRKLLKRRKKSYRNLNRKSNRKKHKRISLK